MSPEDILEDALKNINGGLYRMRCALCEKNVDSLIESHLLPRALYRALRNMGPNERILQVNQPDGTFYYHDKQIKAPLLCSGCEDLFSKKGERPLGLLWATGKGFKLREELYAIQKYQQLKGMRLYFSEDLPAHCVDPILYFCLSLFWRGDVWPKTLHSGYNRSLGPYRDMIRDYLLHGTEISNFRLMIIVNTNDDFNAVMLGPTLIKRKALRVHYASMQGIQFFFYIGGSINDPQIVQNFEGSKSGIIFVTQDTANSTFIRNLAREVGQDFRPTGKLGFEAER